MQLENLKPPILLVCLLHIYLAEICTLVDAF